MSDARVTVEMIRLLLQVAWADDSIAPEEYDYLFAMAKRAGFSHADIMSLDKGLRNRKLLHEPNLEVLREHREEALGHVQALIEADDRIAPEEVEFLHKVAAALG